jgi:ABC-2 type transport system permease protein
MKTMQWLVKREMWEHKGMLFWTPVVEGAVMALFAAAMLLFALTGNDLNATLTVNGRSGTVSHVIGNALGSSDLGHTARLMGSTYMAAASPLFLTLGALVFFYCLGALYDERRDRSLLFWKALPVSDAQTVLSKAGMALAVVPAIVVAVGTLTSLLLLLMLCTLLAANGVNLFGQLLATPDLYLTPLRIAALLPVYALWALPTVGWLLMVSAWARSKVLLWALGLPALTVLLALWANKSFNLMLNVEWFMEDVIGRALLGVVPGYWFLFDKVQHQAMLDAGANAFTSSDLLSYSWATLGGVGVWVGAAAGAAMIFAAIKLRQSRAEC